MSGVVESPGAFVVPGVGAASSPSVSSSATRGGATHKTNTPKPPRRSPTSFSSGNISSGGVRGGEKTKNLTNRERGSISKAMGRMAESIESGGGGTVGVI